MADEQDMKPEDALKIIEDRGYTDYLNIVEETIKLSNEHGISNLASMTEDEKAILARFYKNPA